MKKAKRHISRWGIGIIIFFLVLWCAAFIILNRYKEVIRDLTIKEVNHHIIGTASLGEITTTFFSTFPFPSVGIDNVMIRDTMWEKHSQNLFDAKRIKIYFKWLSLLRLKPELSQVVIQDAVIHLYTDSTGYSNLIEITNTDGSKPHTEFPEFKFSNTRFIIENKLKNTKHDIDASHLQCNIRMEKSIANIELSIKSLIHGIGFNLARGSYLSEKTLKGKIELTFEPKQKIELKEAQLQIDHHPFNIKGNIFLHTDTMSYELLFSTSQITYKNAASLLTKSIQDNIQLVDIIDPFDIEAEVSGKMAQYVIPQIKTKFIVRDASMESPIGHLEHCTFTGTFHNQDDPLLDPGDANSRLMLKDISLTWNNFSITSNKIDISNLLKPFLDCHIASQFQLSELNNLSDFETIKFLQGTGNANVMYKGSLAGDLSMLPFANGSIVLTDAEIEYVPRSLLFKKCSGELIFKDQGLELTNLQTTIGHSQVTMNGHIDNLLTLLNQNPEKLTLDLSVNSPDIDLNDFISYARSAVPYSKKKAVKKTKISTVIDNTEKMLRNGTAKLNISAGHLRYKKFNATAINASLSLESNKVSLKGVSLKYAKGTASLKGSLVHGAGTNKLKLEAHIKSVDIPVLFTDFDAFGQDALTASNTKGMLTSDIVITGELTDKAVIKENSVNGVVDFSVTQGELIRFEPMMKITEVAFKKRDFSQIKFAELENQLKIVGSAYHINKMEIRSNVAVLFVEGVYDPKLGTDMSIQVPVNNLTKAEHDYAANKGKVGVNIRLRAKTGDDGKLKVAWDPLNNAGKQRKAATKKDSLPASEKKNQ